MEEQLIKMIQQGGKAAQAAFGRIYSSKAVEFRRFFIANGLTLEDAKDVTQETFVKIVRNIDSFRGEGAANAWLWQIARNCLTDHIRKRCARPEDTANDERWSIIEQNSEALRLQDAIAFEGNVDNCVSAGLQRFEREEPERAYALMLQMEDHSTTIIGERIGRSPGATREYLSQCRKKLQPFIEHCLEHLA